MQIETAFDHLDIVYVENGPGDIRKRIITEILVRVKSPYGSTNTAPSTTEITYGVNLLHDDGSIGSRECHYDEEKLLDRDEAAHRYAEGVKIVHAKLFAPQLPMYAPTDNDNDEDF